MTQKSIIQHANTEARQLKKLGLFTAIAADKIGTQTMTQIVQQFAFLSEAFSKALCELAARMPSDKARAEIIANAWDEHGRGNPSDSHQAMLTKFLAAYFTNSGEITWSPTWQTRLFLNATRGLYQHGTPSEAIGALFFVEMITPWEFTQISKWMRRNTSLADHKMLFWDDHIKHDGMHASSLLKAYLGDAGMMPSDLLSGITQARTIEETFWRQFL